MPISAYNGRHGSRSNHDGRVQRGGGTPAPADPRSSVGGERPVNDLVAVLGLPQPLVSKHLRVLREVGLVDVRDAGRQRVYCLNGRRLKPIHDWVKAYEASWSRRFDRLDDVLNELKDQEFTEKEDRHGTDGD